MRLLNVFFFCCWLWLGFGSPSHAQSIPTFAQVQQQHQSSDRYVLARGGELLQTVRVDWQSRRGDWLSLMRISPALIRVLLQAEDQRFYEHGGVDWLAVMGTSWFALWGQRLRGTSTLSMQLVDLLGLGVGRQNGQRSVSAKWQQMRLAQQLEAQWSKAQILEAYLNLVPFRGELIGVDAMSKVLWQKQAQGLTLAESSLAVAMLPSPNTTIERLQQRSCRLWRSIQATADCAPQLWRNQQALGRLHQPAWGNPQLAPHAAQWLLRHGLNPGQTIDSTLDGVLQRQAQQIMQHHLAGLNDLNVHDAAILVLSNTNGQVLAYVGSSQQSGAPQFDHVQALRQAGSTLKPFLYQLAFEQLRITPASLLADEAVEFATPYGLYVPQNYDEQFMGWVSARVALASSLNIPAVKVLAQVGVEHFQTYLEQLGFHLPFEPDYYGLGLALGGGEVSLWQLTNAYRSLANLGQSSDLCLLMSCVSTSKQVATPEASWLVQHVLADNTARAMTFGLDSALATPFWSAVKTGTSKDMRDNWTIGFSQDYTVGVWVGNSDGSAMREVSGVTGAAPIWHELMVFLHRGVSSEVTEPPQRIKCQTIHFSPPLEASRQECFIKGTERQLVQLEAQVSAVPKILSPLSQTVYALDPDLPLEQQKIKIQAVGPERTAIVWRINGVVVTDDVGFYWLPTIGRHQIELLKQGDNQLLDTVYIEVRG